ncbi:MAG: hypothetical protein JO256_00720 [Alphaproteobacteria bacterium]|nr:hypothetical protein [Alphaproteobacteria bacterium]
MGYSRKRYWLSGAAVLAVLTSWIAFVHLGRPPQAIVPWMSLVVVLLAAGFAFLAFFSRDEIQRQNRMRAWYYGGTLAIFFGVAPIVLLVSNANLEAIVAALPHAPSAALHAPKMFFILGVVVTLLFQSLGNYVARIVMRLRS